MKNAPAGTIVRVRLKNFVTYSSAEFSFSPTLNMVVGPNGTGKSTFVCAICLGLCGNPSLLGRQKTISEFVKNGQQSGIIEIELKNFKGKRNLIITRNININNSSQWYLNGNSCSEKTVKNSIKDMNIQIDNLCQFLPQDRVVEFARLKSEMLLQETERAVGSINLLSNHKKLIEIDEIFEEILKQINFIKNQINDLNHLQEGLKPDVEKEENLKKFKKDIDYAYIHLSIIKYNELKDDFTKARDDVKKAANELSKYDDDTRPLDNKLAQRKQEGREITEELDTITNVVFKQKDQYNTVVKKMENLQNELSSIQGEIDSKKKERDRNIKKRDQYKERLGQEKDRFNNLKLPNPEELTRIKDELRQLNSKKYKFDEAYDEEKKSLQRVRARIQENKIQIKTLSIKIQKNDRIGILRSIKNRQGTNLFNAINYLRDNPDRFEGKYLEPPIMTVTASDPYIAAILETVLTFQMQLAITTTSRENYKEIAYEILDKRHFNVGLRDYSNRRPIDHPPMALDELKQLGFDGYITDFINGPPEVIKMLCYEAHINEIPVSKRDFTPQQMERVNNLVRNDRNVFIRYVAGGISYSIGRSKYGSRQRYTTSLPIKDKAYLFSVTGITDSTLNRIEQQMAEKGKQNEQLEEEEVRILEKGRSVKTDTDEIINEMRQLTNDKERMVRARKDYQRSESDINLLQEELDNIIRSLRKDDSTEIERAVKRRGKCLMKLAHVAIEASTTSRHLIKYSDRLTKAKLTKLSFESDINTLKELIEACTGGKERLTRQLEELKHQAKILRSSLKESQGRVTDIMKDLEDVDKDAISEKMASYQEEGIFDQEHIQIEIQRLKNLVRLNTVSNHGAKEQYETRLQEINALEEKLERLVQNRQIMEQDIVDIRADWEPELDRLISVISQRFSESFSTVGSAGEVSVAKLDRFRDWRLEIRVKFRDESELRQLDGSFQSGGERAVSTAFYMLALQTLTKSPFRVVDEINQGMDPRNERIVHRHMVKIGCEESACQYFLITPKLLSNLYYHKTMRVHFIMAGAFVPDPSKERKYLTFGQVRRYT